MTRFAATVRTWQHSAEVLITAHPMTSVRELFASLGPAADPAGRLLVNGREVPPGATLASAGVRDGGVLGGGALPVAVPTAAPGSLALLVASGPAAGASVAIPPAGAVVGRAAPLVLGDHEISQRHFQVGAASDGSFLVADLGSTNGTVVGGQAVTAARPLAPGELIWAGQSALAVDTAPAGDAALSQGEDGRLRYSRSPRLAQPPVARPADVPDPPKEPDKPPFPVLAVIAPVLVGVLMAVLLKQLEYLAFIALSPIMLIGNAVSDRRRGKRGYAQRLADYEQRRDHAAAQLAAARRAELAYRRHVHPDPATLLLIATAPSRRLWERHARDEDFLALRVGTGTVPWSVPGPGRPAGHDDGAAGELGDAPIVLPLPECGAAGLAGTPARARALARGMLLSLMTLHSPLDVSVTLLTAPDTAADWDWIRWLPHARQPGSSDCAVRVGNDPETIRLRVAELNAALEARHPGTVPGRPPARPATCDVVILDGAYRLRLDVDLDSLLRDGPAAGIYFICLDETPARLPPECRQALVELSEDAGAVVAHVHRPGREVSGAAPDVVAPQVTERASRAMAPVSEAGTRTASEALPDSVRFLQIAGLEPPTAAQVRSRWASAGRTTRALLGVRADGPFTLDLIQGPHLLVAGTTGSGKSEFLQTLVASLAVANRPDAMNFVLVDYKGGAAFRACEPLPHTVGMVTDLDEFAVDRALTSLRAELQRRKTVLGEADKPNIGLYWDALPVMPGADPLPRLVIVVDEFAVMAEQLPSQLRSLVDIGMQGRSLGIHLVLATQRPAGVVTADLRANINLRVALRVTSPEDSRDVIETVDAARIPAENSAGRAYAWLGGGRPVAFQAARVGGLRPGVVPANSAATVAAFGWAALGRPLPRADEAKPDPSDPTDLSTLVAAVKAAAQEEGIAPQHTPWQPPLPDLLTLGQAPRLAGPASPAPAAGPPPLVFGAVDHPRTQQQVPAALDLARGGHLLVAGAPQSGRTTLLRTLAGCLAAQVSPDDVHLYAIDCGGGLAALSALAHCGAVVTPAEPDRVDRLLARLTREVAHRTRLMSAGGHGDLAEYRQALPAAGRPPFLLVFVDRYDAFVTALGGVDNGRLVSDLQRLIRDGLAAGVRAVVTGDRSLLLGPLAGLAEDKIVLRMADRNDYSIVGLSPKAMPAKVPSGRGFRVPGGDMLQVAVLSGEAQGAAQNQALRALAGRQPRPATRAFRVDALPPMITYEQACELPPGGDGVLVGVGGDDLSQVRADTPALLVLGQPRSGRSTALAVQARSLATAGAPVVLVTPRRSLLATAVGPAGVALRLESAGAEAAAQLRAALADGGPAVIVVDDADQLTDTPLGDELTAVCRRIRDTAHRLLAAAVPDSATGFRGLVPELAKAKCGLVLEPATPNDGAPFGARLAASVLASGTPLRGAFVHYGTVVAVQVPSIGNSVTEPVRSGADQP